MQFALKNFTRSLQNTIQQAKVGRSLLNQRMQKYSNYKRAPHPRYSHLEETQHLKKSIFQKVSYKFVSIAVPFKTQRPVMGVAEFLAAHQLEYIDGPGVYKVKVCPFCTKPHHNDRTNLYTLNLNKDYGYYHCFRCSSKGSWLQFRERVLGFTQQMFEHLEADSSAGYSDYNRSKQTKMADAQYFIYRNNIAKEQYKDVMDYLQSRGFNAETIKQYNIGAGFEEFFDTNGDKVQIKCVYFPFYKILKENQQKQLILDQFKRKEQSTSNYCSNNNWTQIVKAKARGNGKQNKRYMRQLPVGGQRGFFGMNVIKDTDNTIVLTEGQFDAMAVYQQTGIPALSLPQGATNLSEALLPYLDRFEKIILWMDNDAAGILNTSKIVEKLGINRTHVVSHDVPKMKDANDFLLHNPGMISQVIHKAKTIPDSSLLSFNAVRDIIFAKISKTEENYGIKISWLPFFNKVVKGVRMGELTIMSGPTGSGKTTFLTQMTLDLCKKDITVLWGSFEIRNQILITSMLYQFSDLKLDKHLSKYEYFADKFAKLPLHFMNFYGSHSIDKILSTIIYSIQKYNVHVVVIDTLQFLLSEQADGFKKFQLQDTLMAKLREISIKYNIQVIIVIHPRKTEDNEDIGIHSIYGTSKATQQADNIWLIQNRENFKVFDVKKNRYDGQLGRIPIGFNRNSKNFFQLSKEQFEALRCKEKSMADVVLMREQQKSTEKSEIDIEYQSIFNEQIIDSDLNRAKKTYNNSFKGPSAKQ